MMWMSLPDKIVLLAWNSTRKFKKQLLPWGRYFSLISMSDSELSDKGTGQYLNCSHVKFLSHSQKTENIKHTFAMTDVYSVCL